MTVLPDQPGSFERDAEQRAIAEGLPAHSDGLTSDQLEELNLVAIAKHCPPTTPVPIGGTANDIPAIAGLLIFGPLCSNC